MELFMSLSLLEICRLYKSFDNEMFIAAGASDTEAMKELLTRADYTEACRLLESYGWIGAFICAIPVVLLLTKLFRSGKRPVLGPIVSALVMGALWVFLVFYSGRSYLQGDPYQPLYNFTVIKAQYVFPVGVLIIWWFIYLGWRERSDTQEMSEPENAPTTVSAPSASEAPDAASSQPEIPVQQSGLPKPTEKELSLDLVRPPVIFEVEPRSQAVMKTDKTVTVPETIAPSAGRIRPQSASPMQSVPQEQTTAPNPEVKSAKALFPCKAAELLVKLIPVFFFLLLCCLILNGRRSATEELLILASVFFPFVMTIGGGIIFFLCSRQPVNAWFDTVELRLSLIWSMIASVLALISIALLCKLSDWNDWYDEDLAAAVIFACVIWYLAVVVPFAVCRRNGVSRLKNWISNGSAKS